MRRQSQESISKQLFDEYVASRLKEMPSLEEGDEVKVASISAAQSIFLTPVGEYDARARGVDEFPKLKQKLGNNGYKPAKSQSFFSFVNIGGGHWDLVRYEIGTAGEERKTTIQCKPDGACGAHAIVNAVLNDPQLKKNPAIIEVAGKVGLKLDIKDSQDLVVAINFIIAIIERGKGYKQYEVGNKLSTEGRTIGELNKLKGNPFNSNYWVGTECMEAFGRAIGVLCVNAKNVITAQDTKLHQEEMRDVISNNIKGHEGGRNQKSEIEQLREFVEQKRSTDSGLRQANSEQLFRGVLKHVAPSVDFVEEGLLPPPIIPSRQPLIITPPQNTPKPEPIKTVLFDSYYDIDNGSGKPIIDSKDAVKNRLKTDSSEQEKFALFLAKHEISQSSNPGFVKKDYDAQIVKELGIIGISPVVVPRILAQKERNLLSFLDLLTVHFKIIDTRAGNMREILGELDSLRKTPSTGTPIKAAKKLAFKNDFALEQSFILEYINVIRDWFGNEPFEFKDIFDSEGQVTTTLANFIDEAKSKLKYLKENISLVDAFAERAKYLRSVEIENPDGSKSKIGESDIAVVTKQKSSESLELNFQFLDALPEIVRDFEVLRTPAKIEAQRVEAPVDEKLTTKVAEHLYEFVENLEHSKEDQSKAKSRSDIGRDLLGFLGSISHTRRDVEFELYQGEYDRESAIKGMADSIKAALGKFDVNTLEGAVENEKLNFRRSLAPRKSAPNVKQSEDPDISSIKTAIKKVIIESGLRDVMSASLAKVSKGCIEGVVKDIAQDVEKEVMKSFGEDDSPIKNILYQIEADAAAGVITGATKDSLIKAMTDAITFAIRESAAEIVRDISRTASDEDRSAIGDANQGLDISKQYQENIKFLADVYFGDQVSDGDRKQITKLLVLDGAAITDSKGFMQEVSTVFVGYADQLKANAPLVLEDVQEPLKSSRDSDTSYDEATMVALFQDHIAKLFAKRQNFSSPDTLKKHKIVFVAKDDNQEYQGTSLEILPGIKPIAGQLFCVIQTGEVGKAVILEPEFDASGNFTTWKQNNQIDLKDDAAIDQNTVILRTMLGVILSSDSLKNNPQILKAAKDSNIDLDKIDIKTISVGEVVDFVKRIIEQGNVDEPAVTRGQLRADLKSQQPLNAQFYVQQFFQALSALDRSYVYTSDNDFLKSDRYKKEYEKFLTDQAKEIVGALLKRNSFKRQSPSSIVFTPSAKSTSSSPALDNLRGSLSEAPGIKLSMVEDFLQAFSKKKDGIVSASIEKMKADLLEGDGLLPPQPTKTPLTDQEVDELFREYIKSKLDDMYPTVSALQSKKAVFLASTARTAKVAFFKIAGKLARDEKDLPSDYKPNKDQLFFIFLGQEGNRALVIAKYDSTRVGDKWEVIKETKIEQKESLGILYAMVEAVLQNNDFKTNPKIIAAAKAVGLDLTSSDVNKIDKDVIINFTKNIIQQSGVKGQLSGLMDKVPTFDWNIKDEVKAKKQHDKELDIKEEDMALFAKALTALGCEVWGLYGNEPLSKERRDERFTETLAEYLGAELSYGDDFKLFLSKQGRTDADEVLKRFSEIQDQKLDELKREVAKEKFESIVGPLRKIIEDLQLTLYPNGSIANNISLEALGLYIDELAESKNSFGVAFKVGYRDPDKDLKLFILKEYKDDIAKIKGDIEGLLVDFRALKTAAEEIKNRKDQLRRSASNKQLLKSLRNILQDPNDLLAKAVEKIKGFGEGLEHIKKSSDKDEKKINDVIAQISHLKAIDTQLDEIITPSDKFPKQEDKDKELARLQALLDSKQEITSVNDLQKTDALAVSHDLHILLEACQDFLLVLGVKDLDSEPESRTSFKELLLNLESKNLTPEPKNKEAINILKVVAEHLKATAEIIADIKGVLEQLNQDKLISSTANEYRDFLEEFNRIKSLYDEQIRNKEEVLKVINQDVLNRNPALKAESELVLRNIGEQVDVVRGSQEYIEGLEKEILLVSNLKAIAKDLTEIAGRIVDAKKALEAIDPSVDADKYGDLLKKFDADKLLYDAQITKRDKELEAINILDHNPVLKEESGKTLGIVDEKVEAVQGAKKYIDELKAGILLVDNLKAIAKDLEKIVGRIVGTQEELEKADPSVNIDDLLEQFHQDKLLYDAQIAKQEDVLRAVDVLKDNPALEAESKKALGIIDAQVALAKPAKGYIEKEHAEALYEIALEKLRSEQGDVIPEKEPKANNLQEASVTLKKLLERGNGDGHSLFLLQSFKEDNPEFVRLTAHGFMAMNQGSPEDIKRKREENVFAKLLTEAKAKIAVLEVESKLRAAGAIKKAKEVDQIQQDMEAESAKGDDLIGKAIEGVLVDGVRPEVLAKKSIEVLMEAADRSAKALAEAQKILSEAIKGAEALKKELASKIKDYNQLMADNAQDEKIIIPDEILRTNFLKKAEAAVRKAKKQSEEAQEVVKDIFDRAGQKGALYKEKEVEIVAAKRKIEEAQEAKSKADLQAPPPPPSIMQKWLGRKPIVAPRVTDKDIEILQENLVKLEAELKVIKDEVFEAAIHAAINEKRMDHLSERVSGEHGIPLSITEVASKLSKLFEELGGNGEPSFKKVIKNIKDKDQLPRIDTIIDRIEQILKPLNLNFNSEDKIKNADYFIELMVAVRDKMLDPSADEATKKSYDDIKEQLGKIREGLIEVLEMRLANLQSDEISKEDLAKKITDFFDVAEQTNRSSSELGKELAELLDQTQRNIDAVKVVETKTKFQEEFNPLSKRVQKASTSGQEQIAGGQKFVRYIKDTMARFIVLEALQELFPDAAKDLTLRNLEFIGVRHVVLLMSNRESLDLQSIDVVNDRGRVKDLIKEGLKSLTPTATSLIDDLKSSIGDESVMTKKIPFKNKIPLAVEAVQTLSDILIAAYISNAINSGDKEVKLNAKDLVKVLSEITGKKDLIDTPEELAKTIKSLSIEDLKRLFENKSFEKTVGLKSFFNTLVLNGLKFLNIPKLESLVNDCVGSLGRADQEYLAATVPELEKIAREAQVAVLVMRDSCSSVKQFDEAVKSGSTTQVPLLSTKSWVQPKRPTIVDLFPKKPSVAAIPEVIQNALNLIVNIKEILDRPSIGGLEESALLELIRLTYSLKISDVAVERINNLNLKLEQFQGVIKLCEERILEEVDKLGERVSQASDKIRSKSIEIPDLFMAQQTAEKALNTLDQVEKLVTIRNLLEVKRKATFGQVEDDSFVKEVLEINRDAKGDFEHALRSRKPVKPTTLPPLRKEPLPPLGMIKYPPGMTPPPPGHGSNDRSIAALELELSTAVKKLEGVIGKRKETAPPAFVNLVALKEQFVATIFSTEDEIRKLVEAADNVIKEILNPDKGSSRKDAVEIGQKSVAMVFEALRSALKEAQESGASKDLLDHIKDVSSQAKVLLINALPKDDKARISLGSEAPEDISTITPKVIEAAVERVEIERWKKVFAMDELDFMIQMRPSIENVPVALAALLESVKEDEKRLSASSTKSRFNLFSTPEKEDLDELIKKRDAILEKIEWVVTNLMAQEASDSKIKLRDGSLEIDYEYLSYLFSLCKVKSDQTGPDNKAIFPIFRQVADAEVLLDLNNIVKGLTQKIDQQTPGAPRKGNEGDNDSDLSDQHSVSSVRTNKKGLFGSRPPSARKSDLRGAGGSSKDLRTPDGSSKKLGKSKSSNGGSMGNVMRKLSFRTPRKSSRDEVLVTEAELKLLEIREELKDARERLPVLRQEIEDLKVKAEEVGDLITAYEYAKRYVESAIEKGYKEIADDKQKELEEVKVKLRENGLEINADGTIAHLLNDQVMIKEEEERQLLTRISNLAEEEDEAIVRLAQAERAIRKKGESPSSPLPPSRKKSDTTRDLEGQLPILVDRIDSFTETFLGGLIAGDLSDVTKLMKDAKKNFLSTGRQIKTHELAIAKKEAQLEELAEIPGKLDSLRKELDAEERREFNKDKIIAKLEQEIAEIRKKLEPLERKFHLKEAIAGNNKVSRHERLEGAQALNVARRELKKEQERLGLKNKEKQLVEEQKRIWNVDDLLEAREKRDERVERLKQEISDAPSPFSKYAISDEDIEEIKGAMNLRGEEIPAGWNPRRFDAETQKIELRLQKLIRLYEKLLQKKEELNDAVNPPVNPALIDGEIRLLSSQITNISADPLLSSVLNRPTTNQDIQQQVALINLYKELHQELNIEFKTIDPEALEKQLREESEVRKAIINRSIEALEDRQKAIDDPAKIRLEIGQEEQKLRVQKDKRLEILSAAADPIDTARKLLDLKVGHPPFDKDMTSALEGCVRDVVLLKQLVNENSSKGGVSFQELINLDIFKSDEEAKQIIRKVFGSAEVLDLAVFNDRCEATIGRLSGIIKELNTLRSQVLDAENVKLDKIVPIELAAFRQRQKLEKEEREKLVREEQKYDDLDRKLASRSPGRRVEIIEIVEEVRVMVGISPDEIPGMTSEQKAASDMKKLLDVLRMEVEKIEKLMDENNLGARQKDDGKPMSEAELTDAIRKSLNIVTQERAKLEKLENDVGDFSSYVVAREEKRLKKSKEIPPVAYQTSQDDIELIRELSFIAAKMSSLVSAAKATIDGVNGLDEVSKIERDILEKRKVVVEKEKKARGKALPATDKDVVALNRRIAEEIALPSVVAKKLLEKDRIKAARLVPPPLIEDKYKIYKDTDVASAEYRLRRVKEHQVVAAKAFAKESRGLQAAKDELAKIDAEVISLYQEWRRLQTLGDPDAGRTLREHHDRDKDLLQARRVLDIVQAEFDSVLALKNQIDSAVAICAESARLILLEVNRDLEGKPITQDIVEESKLAQAAEKESIKQAALADRSIGILDTIVKKTGRRASLVALDDVLERAKKEERAKEVLKTKKIEDDKKKLEKFDEEGFEKIDKEAPRDEVGKIDLDSGKGQEVSDRLKDYLAARLREDQTRKQEKHLDRGLRDKFEEARYNLQGPLDELRRRQENLAQIKMTSPGDLVLISDAQAEVARQAAIVRPLQIEYNKIVDDPKFRFLQDFEVSSGIVPPLVAGGTNIRIKLEELKKYLEDKRIGDPNLSKRIALFIKEATGEILVLDENGRVAREKITPLEEAAGKLGKPIYSKSEISVVGDNITIKITTGVDEALLKSIDGFAVDWLKDKKDVDAQLAESQRLKLRVEALSGQKMTIIPDGYEKKIDGEGKEVDNLDRPTSYKVIARPPYNNINRSGDRAVLEVATNFNIDWSKAKDDKGAISGAIYGRLRELRQFRMEVETLSDQRMTLMPEISVEQTVTFKEYRMIFGEDPNTKLITPVDKDNPFEDSSTVKIEVPSKYKVATIEKRKLDDKEIRVGHPITTVIAGVKTPVIADFDADISGGQIVITGAVNLTIRTGDIGELEQSGFTQETRQLIYDSEHALEEIKQEAKIDRANLRYEDFRDSALHSLTYAPPTLAGSVIRDLGDFLKNVDSSLRGISANAADEEVRSIDVLYGLRLGETLIRVLNKELFQRDSELKGVVNADLGAVLKSILDDQGKFKPDVVRNFLGKDENLSPDFVDSIVKIIDPNFVQETIENLFGDFKSGVINERYLRTQLGHLEFHIDVENQIVDIAKSPDDDAKKSTDLAAILVREEKRLQDLRTNLCADLCVAEVNAIEQKKINVAIEKIIQKLFHEFADKKISEFAFRNQLRDLHLAAFDAEDKIIAIAKSTDTNTEKSQALAEIIQGKENGFRNGPAAKETRQEKIDRIETLETDPDALIEQLKERLIELRGYAYSEDPLRVLNRISGISADAAKEILEIIYKPLPTNLGNVKAEELIKASNLQSIYDREYARIDSLTRVPEAERKKLKQKIRDLGTDIGAIRAKIDAGAQKARDDKRDFKIDLKDVASKDDASKDVAIALKSYGVSPEGIKDVLVSIQKQNDGDPAFVSLKDIFDKEALKINRQESDLISRIESLRKAWEDADRGSPEAISMMVASMVPGLKGLDEGDLEKDARESKKDRLLIATLAEVSTSVPVSYKDKIISDINADAGLTADQKLERIAKALQSFAHTTGQKVAAMKELMSDEYEKIERDFGKLKESHKKALQVLANIERLLTPVVPVEASEEAKLKAENQQALQILVKINALLVPGLGLTGLETGDIKNANQEASKALKRIEVLLAPGVALKPGDKEKLQAANEELLKVLTSVETLLTPGSKLKADEKRKIEAANEAASKILTDIEQLLFPVVLTPQQIDDLKIAKTKSQEAADKIQKRIDKVIVFLAAKQKAEEKDEISKKEWYEKRAAEHPPLDINAENKDYDPNKKRPTSHPAPTSETPLTDIARVEKVVQEWMDGADYQKMEFWKQGIIKELKSSLNQTGGAYVGVGINARTNDRELKITEVFAHNKQRFYQGMVADRNQAYNPDFLTDKFVSEVVINGVFFEVGPQGSKDSKGNLRVTPKKVVELFRSGNSDITFKVQDTNPIMSKSEGTIITCARRPNSIYVDETCSSNTVKEALRNKEIKGIKGVAGDAYNIRDHHFDVFNRVGNDQTFMAKCSAIIEKAKAEGHLGGPTSVV